MDDPASSGDKGSSGSGASVNPGAAHWSVLRERSRGLEDARRCQRAFWDHGEGWQNLSFVCLSKSIYPLITHGGGRQKEGEHCVLGSIWREELLEYCSCSRGVGLKHPA